MLIVSLLTLVHLVAASSSLRIAHPIKALNTRDLVVARQTSTSTNGTVPAQCETDCDPIEAALAQIQDECPPEDCCQSDFITGYAICLECLGNALGATNFTTAQQALNNLTMQCNDAEHSVTSLTLPGPVTSGGLSSALATVIPTQTSNAPADASPPLFTIAPAPSSNTPAQSTTNSSPAQSTTTTTTSSANQNCLIPLHVQVSLVLLGGLVHLAL